MLPDGSTIEIGKARFRAPEVLFRPDLIGEECHGLHEVSLLKVLLKLSLITELPRVDIAIVILSVSFAVQ